MLVEKLPIPIARKKRLKCGNDRLASEFRKNASKKDGLASTCMYCVEDWRLVNTYGITLDDYNEMLHKQNNVCALCQRSDTNRLSVDHDHETGKVRGLVCSRCNWALGVLGDTPEKLSRVVEYLRRS